MDPHVAFHRNAPQDDGLKFLSPSAFLTARGKEGKKGMDCDNLNLSVGVVGFADFNTNGNTLKIKGITKA